jgi:hypothetical protein
MDVHCLHRPPGHPWLQAGFLVTASVSMLLTAQMAHILHPHFPILALLPRLLALAGLPCIASFLVDAYHRTCFLRAAARPPRAAAKASCTASDDNGAACGKEK